MATHTHRSPGFTCRFTGEAVQDGPAVTDFVPLVVEAGAVTEVVLSTGDGETAVAVRGLPASWFTLGVCPPGAEGIPGAEPLLVLHPPYAQHLSPHGDYDFTVVFAREGAAEQQVLARLAVLPPLATQPHSRYLDYLPALFRESDPYLGRMLLVFQSVMDPLERLVDTADIANSPELAPERFLPWLARWVGVSQDTNNPGAARTAIASAPELARWNGTRRALREHLQQASGAAVLMAENTNGMRLGQDAVLGVSTLMGAARPHTLAVTLVPTRSKALDVEQAQRVLAAQAPAWVDYTLRVAATTGGAVA